MFKKGKYTCIFNKHKIVPEGDYYVDTEVWNHLAISIQPKDKSVLIVHNGQTIYNSSEIEVSLQKLGKTTLMICPEFSGKITEVRMWKRAKDAEEIRSNQTTPLSIVSEQSAMVIINLKKPGEVKNKQAEPVNDADFNIGNIVDVQPQESAGFDNWNFGAPSPAVDSNDNWGISQPSDVRQSENATEVHVKEDSALKAEQKKLTEEIDPKSPPLKHSPQLQSKPVKESSPSNSFKPDFTIEDNSANDPDDPWQIPKQQPHSNKPIETSPKTSGLFKKHQFAASVTQIPAYHSKVTSILEDLDNQSNLLQRLSSELLVAAKACRSLNAKELYDEACAVTDVVFSSVKNVSFNDRRNLKIFT